MKKTNNLHLIIILGILTIFFGITFFVWTTLPYAQMGQYYGALKEIRKSAGDSFYNNKFIFSPYTYIQPALRKNFLTFLLADYTTNKTSASLLPFAIKQLEDVAERDNKSPELFLLLGRGYTAMALVDKTNPEYPAKAEGNYKKALMLWPESEEVIFGYSISLVNQNKTNEAISILKNALEGEPQIIKLNNYLGYALYKSGPSNYDEALRNFEIAFTGGGDNNDKTTTSIYLNLLLYYYNNNDIERFKIVLYRLEKLDQSRTDSYNKIDQYLKQTGRLPQIKIEQ